MQTYCSDSYGKRPAAAWAFALGGLLLLMQVLLASGPAAAQSFVRKQWTVTDGLPANAVNHLLQTRDGYLWLATFDGLVRFDGVRFTVLNTQSADGLPSNRIVQLHEDVEGNLWLITEQNHLVRFREGVFTHFDESRGLPGIFTGSLYEDDTGTLWVGTNRGAARYQDGQIQLYRPEAIDAYVIALLRDATDNLWIGTSGRGLLLLRPDGTLQRFTTANGLMENVVTHIFEDRDGVIWISTTKGVSRRVGQQFVPLGNGTTPWEMEVLRMHQDADGAYWLATNNGWFIYHQEQLSPFKAEDQDPSGLGSRVLRGPADHLWVSTPRTLYRDGEAVFESEDALTNFMHDREGNLWVATNTEGLFRLRPSVFGVFGVPEGLPGRTIYPILQDRSGSVWLGTLNRGLARLSGETAATYTEENGRLPSNHVWSLYEDRQGTLWAGGTGLYRREGDRFVQSPLSPRTADNVEDVLALYEDRQSRFWAGTENGLFRKDTGAATWTHLTTDNGLTHDWVHILYETADGTLWLGTNGGGLMTHGQDDRFTPFTTADGLCSDFIQALYEDRDGILWVGTKDQGLCRIDRHGADGLEQATATPIRMSDGLFDNSIRQILEDDQGRLWMGTSRGIFWVERAALNAFAAGTADAVRSIGYTERDGMRNREVNGGGQPAGIKAHDGRLWFPTQHGAVVVDPASIRSPQAPPVVIEAVSVDDDVQRPGAALTLASKQHDLKIDYTALTFRAPETVTFRYRLDGLGDDWNEAGTRRTATYSNLPPGTYTFRVIASTGGGWSEEGATLTITRTPLFFETPWFYALCGLLALLGFVGLYRYRVRRLRVRTRELEQKVTERTTEVEAQKNQLAARNSQLSQNEVQLEQQAARLMQLDEMKSRFFANISHEFRTPLTLILGPLQDLQDHQYGPLPHEVDSQLRLVHRNGRRLLHLIDQLLDLSKLEAGGMVLQARRHDLVGFLRNLTGAFESLAHSRNLTLSFEAPADALPHHFDADKLEKAVLNLLSNAFKFTDGGGAITVRVHRPADKPAVIEVRDTGSGIPAEHLSHLFDRFYQVDESTTRQREGSGIGLALVQELVELHGGTISVASTVGQGTTFTIVLPDVVEGDTVEAVPADPSGDEVPALQKGVNGDGQLHPEALLTLATSPGSPPAPAALDDEDATIILVVEDNADMRAYIRSHLDDSYHIAEAGHGLEGLERARELVPDLVLADVMMPEMDGYALCQALKTDERTSHIPVVLLTARADGQSRIEGLETGADDYLAKPFNAEELRARVRNLIEQRRKLREQFSKEVLVLGAKAVSLPSRDAAFLEKVQEAIEENLGNADFGVDALAEEAAISRRQLLRKLGALTGEKPNEMIRRLRLERAAQLLRQDVGNVKEVAHTTGFRSLSHFRRAFREAYNVPPSEYG